MRSFNRTVMTSIGALNEAFLGRARPLAESRVLWEIGPAGAEVRDLRNRLRLDSGYMSRLLAALENQGLVTVGRSVQDARVRNVRLTRRGARERAELDRRSDAVAETILEPLDLPRRERLVAALAEVERLLRASVVRIEVEDPTTPEAQACLRQYFEELNSRFDTGFDPARSISASADELVPPAGLLLVAKEGNAPIGCGALKLHGEGPAEIKRMWVSPMARGSGIGARILVELERRAKASGACCVRLETNRTLVEAIRLYRQSGYEEVPRFNDEPYADHWFEKRLE